MDSRTARDGRAIEELGIYDPMIPEVDARANLKGERIDYWLSVGAKATPKVGVLIKKYGTSGTHLEQQKVAMERLKIKPQAPPPEIIAKPEPEPPAAEPAPDDEASSDTETEAAATEVTEAPEAEATATETETPKAEAAPETEATEPEAAAEAETSEEAQAEQEEKPEEESTES
jgi:small subunit ribosomal protein S16